MNKINHFFRYTKSTNNYFQRHGKRYLFGTLWAFAIVTIALLFVWFFSTLDLGKSSAQWEEGTTLTSGNIVSMGCATGATSCDLSNQWITSIASDAFVNHRDLRGLYLSQNSLTSIFWVAFPNSLVNLDLAFNQITSLSWIAFPSSLQILNFSSNQITSISGVQFPDSLKILLLGYNKLTSVEQIVFNTESVLEELNLANNEISSIWEGIMGLTSLWDGDWLNVHNNHIYYTQLSSGLLDFIDLKHILVQGDWRKTQTISGWENTCTFSDYTSMQTGHSVAEQVLESNNLGYTCELGKGGADVQITVQAFPLIGPAHNQIPASGVKLKHISRPNITSWDCTLTGELPSLFTDISSPQTLFKKNYGMVCEISASTQLQVTIPADLPSGIYSGDIVFTISEDGIVWST